MKINELRKLSEGELNKRIKQLEIEMMSSNPKFVDAKIKPEQTKSRRRTIAQIKTILNEKKNKDGNKR